MLCPYRLSIFAYTTNRGVRQMVHRSPLLQHTTHANTVDLRATAAVCAVERVIFLPHRPNFGNAENGIRSVHG